MSEGEALNKDPNVLLIVVDCLRADRCPVEAGASGLQFWPRLVSGGTCFSEVISSASATPVCFASLLTGEYSFVHGVESFTGPALQGELATLASVLQESGYHTYAYVTGPLLDVLRMNFGFDVYECRGQEEYVYTDWGKYFLDKLAKREMAEPFFSMLHLWECHMPRQLNGAPEPPTRTQRYDLAWRQLDGWLDRMLEHIPDNTLVVLTADHGETIETPADRTWLGKMCKRLRRQLKLPKRPIDYKEHGSFVFDELNRIPLAFLGPGVPSGKCFSQQVRQIDVMPTLLDFLQRQIPSGIQGRSVVPLMRDQQLPPCSAYVQSGSLEAVRHWHGLRNWPWKYVERPRFSNALDTCPMLFDLSKDPQERHNVIKQHADIAIKMRQQLDQVLCSRQAHPYSSGQSLSPEDQQLLTDRLKALGYM